VIHAASVQSPGIIQLKTPESAAGVLAPKTKGTLILASLVENIPLDFLALFSSTISIAGGFGQVDSCAANAFLDAFANQRSVKNGAFTVAINWSAFQWDQWMLPATTNPSLQEQLQQNLMRNGTSAGEGAQIFKRIIGDTLSQVIVCPQDLASLIEQTDNFTVTSFLEVTKTSTETHPRPALSTPYVEPGNEIEQTIASIWQESFGITQVGVEDNFFDLDGNSLLAIQIVTRLRRAFDIELPMTSLFDAPTVSKLARKVKELKSEPAPVSQLEKLLSEIEMLSADDARQKFAEEQ
jgi:acyl carrier protein